MSQAIKQNPFTLSWIANWHKLPLMQEATCTRVLYITMTSRNNKMPSELLVVYLGSLVVIIGPFGLWGIATSLHTAIASVAAVCGFGRKIASVTGVPWSFSWMEGINFPSKLSGRRDHKDKSLKWYYKCSIFDFNGDIDIPQSVVSCF